MEKSYDIVCIGMAIMDSIIRGFDPEPVLSGYRAESGTLMAGGDAVNEAVAAAKLGLRTGILCSMGTDAAGDMIEAVLAAAGVGTDLIQRSDDHPTPVTTIFVKEDGNRRSITNQAHSYNFHPEQYMDLFDARAVVLGSLFRAPFNDPDVIREVLTVAKLQGMLVFADTKLPNFRRLSLDDIEGMLPMIDFITPNLDEAEHYTDKSRVQDMADVFLEKGVKNVIIKMGADGCYFKGRGNGSGTLEFRVPAFTVDTVDATGAGDNFIAGFASEILRGSDIKKALQFASACGAICTTAVGAGTALTGRSQVEEFLAERNV
jgi:sugar/nucleoside kinase (ribokinase family)